MATVKMKYRGGGEVVVDETLVPTLALQGYSRADGKPIKVGDAPAVNAPRRSGTAAGARSTGRTSASTRAGTRGGTSEGSTGSTGAGARSS